MSNITNNTEKTTYFRLNFPNRTIDGTKARFDKASIGYGPVYESLAALMAKHPDFGFNVIAPAKSKKKKQTYSGLTYGFMKLFISMTQADGETRLLELAAVRAKAKEMNRSPYPLAKRWFLETYMGFDMTDAKEAITEALLKEATSAAKSIIEVQLAKDNEMNEEANKLRAEALAA